MLIVFNRKWSPLVKLFCIFIYFLLYTHPALAERMSSPNFRLEQTNLNMTGGKKSSDNFTVTDTVGQTAAGRFTSSGYIVRAGFQYFYSIIPFTFAVSKMSIPFGTVSAQTPLTDSATLTVSSGGGGGYAVTAIEDDQLRVSPTVFVPDTACDAGDACSVSVAKPWTLATTYGFGYNMTGTDIPATFTDATYFRPFPSQTDGGTPAVVMSDNDVGKNQQSTITFKLNVSSVQEAGQYKNIIRFTATPTY